MGQKLNKVSPITEGEVCDQHLSTPPGPSADTAVQHLHPRDETPVGAGGGGEKGGEEEVRKGAGRAREQRKRKTWWKRLTSCFRAAPKHPPESSPCQQQEEGEKRKVAWAERSSDGK